MNRRQLIGGLAAMAAASVACNRSSGPSSAGGIGETPAKAIASDEAKLRMCFTGLCVFSEQRDKPYFTAGLLDATAAKDPDQERFFEHYPFILIDSSAVGGGEIVNAGDYRLVSEIPQFRKFPLKGHDVTIEGLPTSGVSANFSGAVPLRAMDEEQQLKLIPKWHEQSWVHAAIHFSGGHLFSGQPRPSENGLENVPWKLRGHKAPNEAAWKAIKDIPRQLSDVVEYRAKVKSKPKITLTDRSNASTTVIETTADKSLEIWLINLPEPMKHTKYEEKYSWELQHVRACYLLFDGGVPENARVPIGNPKTTPKPQFQPRKTTSDPIFCPPATVALS